MVKRYDFHEDDKHQWWASITEQREGRYVLHSDYAALLARHNALVEAVTPSAATKAAYMGEFSMRMSAVDEDGEEFTVPVDIPWTTIKVVMKAIAARAEVGRLLAAPVGQDERPGDNGYGVVTEHDLD
jgi:hypothetical protein